MSNGHVKHKSRGFYYSFVSRPYQ